MGKLAGRLYEAVGVDHMLIVLPVLDSIPSPGKITMFQ
jgi:hypothetical protein